MAELNLTHTTNSDDPTSLLSLSGLATPKVQPLPCIEGVTDAYEKRNNYSVLRRNLSGSVLNSSFTSTKNAPTKVDPNTFQSPLLSSLYTPKTLDSSEKLNIFPSHGKTFVESRVLRLNVDKLSNSDVDEFLNNSGGYSQSNSAHRNSPATASSFKKNPENKSRFQVPLLKSPILGSDYSNYSKDGKSPQDGTRHIGFGSDSQRGEERNSARNRTPQRVTVLNKAQSSSAAHFFSFQPEFEPLSAREHINRTKEVFLNMKLLDRVVSFFECADLLKFSLVYREYRQDKQYKSQFKHALNRILLKKMTNTQQYIFWDNFIKFSNLKHAHPTSFTQNFVRKCNYIKDIRMDVDRTFPEYDKYLTEEGKSSLLRVLVAVSNSIAEVGYIQGMNSISGVFLFYMKEEQSFWATLYLLIKLKVKDILNDEFKTVHLLNFQVENFLQSYLPTVANHLKSQSVTLSYITTPWFITLYSYSLPLPLTVKLWNFLFIKGYSFLIQFALAIFSHYENAILGMDPDEVPIYLKSELRELSEHNEALFIKALSFKVTKEMIKDLTYYYENGKPPLFLEKTVNNKLKWARSDNYIISKLQARLADKSRDNHSQNIEHKSIVIDHRRKHSWDTLATMRTNPEKSQKINNIIKANFPEKSSAPVSFESKKSHGVLPEYLNSSQYSRSYIPDSDRNTTTTTSTCDQDILHLLDKTAHKIPNHTDARPVVPSHFKKADLYVDNRIHYASSFSKEPSSFAPPVRQQQQQPEKLENTKGQQYLSMKRPNGLVRTNSLASWGTAALSAERNRNPQSFANDPTIVRETNKPELDDRYFSINPLVNFGPSVNSKGNPSEYQSIPRTLVTIDSAVQKGRNPFKKSESFNVKGRTLLYKANE